MAFGLSLGLGLSALRSSSAPLTAALGSYTGTMNETSDANYTYYEITDSGTLTVTRAGYAEIEMLGPGGPGGGAFFARGGGGGGGERVPNTGPSKTVYLTAGTYALVVGDGGTPGTYSGTDVAGIGGANTTAFGLTALAGGVGGHRNIAQPGSGTNYGGDGASGGGASNSGTNPVLTANGDPGGDGGVGSTSGGGGGGGGMGGDGAAATASAGGNGGAGVQTSFFGSLEWVCEGGGGGGPAGGTAGVAPQSTGGSGGVADGGANATAGAANTGSGGGGAANNSEGAAKATGGAGGTGRIGIRIPTTQLLGIEPTEAPAEAFGYALNAALTSASVPVAGTAYGPNGSIVQARVLDSDDTEVLAWTDVGAVSSNAFSGTLTVPLSSKKCRAVFRWKDGPGTVFEQQTNWTTAARFVFYGQSNTVNMFGTTGGTSTAPAAAKLYEARDGSTGYSLPDGRGVTAWADEWVTLTGIPFMGILGGQSGVPISSLDNNGPGDTTAWEALSAGLSEVGGIVHGFIWHQGEGDVPTIDNAGAVAAYAATLDTIRGLVAGVTGQTATDIPIILSSLCTFGGTPSAGDNDDANWSAVKDMQSEYLPANITNCTFVAPWDDASRLDGYHTYAPSYERRGRREARWAAWVLGEDTAPGRFSIASASAASATTTTVTVTHGLGTDLELVSVDHVTGSDSVNVESSLTAAFEVSVDGFTTPVSCTAVRTNATTITLTHASISTSGRTVRYGYGLNPSECVRDNSAYKVPLLYEMDPVSAPAP